MQGCHFTNRQIKRKWLAIYYLICDSVRFCGKKFIKHYKMATAAASTSVVTGNTPKSGPKKRGRRAYIPSDYVETPVQYLDVAEGRRVAYRKSIGQKQPTILYIPGFFASMVLPKTVIIEMFARKHGYSNVR